MKMKNIKNTNQDYYLLIRKQFLYKHFTRNIIKKFLLKIPLIEDRKKIFLHRYDEDSDFSLFIAACYMQLNSIIEFCIKFCNINLQIRQSLMEIEDIYVCQQCHCIQCNIEKITKEQFTPLMHVIWLRNKPAIENLLKIDKSIINCESYPTGITPLQLACSMNCIEMIRFLINKGANVSKLDYLNKNCLMYVIFGDNWPLCFNKEKSFYNNKVEKIKYKICQYLIENGANDIISIKDKYTNLNVINIIKKLQYSSEFVELFETKK